MPFNDGSSCFISLPNLSNAVIFLEKLSLLGSLINQRVELQKFTSLLVISSSSQQWKLALTMGACTWTTTTTSLVPLFYPVLLPSLLLLSLVLSPAPVLSLHVVLGSSCTAVCTEYYIHPNTTVDQVTCHDSDYNNTSVGQRFKDCISCELQSQTFDHGTSQTDLGWALCKY